MRFSRLMCLPPTRHLESAPSSCLCPSISCRPGQHGESARRRAHCTLMKRAIVFATFFASFARVIG